MAPVSDEPADAPRPLPAAPASPGFGAVRRSASFGELEQMRRLLDTAEVRVALVGPDRRYRYANRAYCDFVGITPEAIVGMSAPEVLGARLYRKLRPVIEAALAGNTSQVEQWVNYPKRGRRFVRRIHTPNVMPDGRLDGYAVFVHDVTEHHRAEDELRASEALKAAVVNGALDGVVAIDTEHRIVEFNPAAERIFGRRRIDVLGRNVADILDLWRIFELHAVERTLIEPVLGVTLIAMTTAISVELFALSRCCSGRIRLVYIGEIVIHVVGFPGGRFRLGSAI